MSILRRALTFCSISANLLFLSCGLSLAQETDAPRSDAQESEAPKIEAPESPEAKSASPGQAALDEATQLRLTAEDARQLNKVIDLLGSAIEKGLDDDNEDFAEQMLVSALLERSEALAKAVLDRPLPDPRQDPRWLQIRQLAMVDLQRVLEIDASQFRAYFLIGRLQSLPLGDDAAALGAFTKVIQSEGVDDQTLAEAHVRRAAKQANDDERLNDLNRAVELAAENVEFRLMRARHYFQTEQFAECLADVDAVLKQAPDNFGTHELRGLVLQAMERDDEALESFDRATELAPEQLTPYIRRSQLYAKQDDLEKAIAEAGKAIDVDSDNPLGYLLRAELLIQDDQADAALEDIEKAGKLQEGLVQAYLLKARAFEQLGKSSEALEQLEELAEALPPQVEIRVQIAAMALQAEQPRRAIRSLDRAIDIDGESFFAYRLRGDAKLNIGEHAEAIADYEKALELEPDDSGVMNNLAWTLATSPTDAVRDGKRALELATEACDATDYKEAHILSTLAAAYAESGDFKKAQEWAQKAVELNDEANGEQIAKELASYKAGKPWREEQKLDSGEQPNTAEATPREPEKPVESKPAPARTIDF